MYILEFGSKFIIFCFNHFCSLLLRFPDFSYSPLLTSDINTASLSFILSNLIKQMTYLKFLSTILLVWLTFYSKYPIIAICFPLIFLKFWSYLVFKSSLYCSFLFVQHCVQRLCSVIFLLFYNMMSLCVLIHDYILIF